MDPSTLASVLSVVRDPVALAAAVPPLALPFFVFASAALEFVVPPFWGDLFVLAGFFFAGQGAASTPSLFAAAVLGSVCGATVAYALGRRYGAAVVRRLVPRRGRRQSALVQRLLRRYGERALLINRFLPVVRAVFLWVAGGARLRPVPVLLYSTVGSLAWIGLLATLGSLGAEGWGQLQQDFRAWSQLGFLIAAGAILGGAAWAARSVRRVARTKPEAG